jgi:hypothetical protein
MFNKLHTPLGKASSRAAILLSVSGLAGCSFSSTENLPNCPSGYDHGAKALVDTQTAYQHLQQGVAELRGHINGSSSDVVEINSISDKYRGAAVTVFNEGTFHGQLNITENTRVDGIQEAVCEGVKGKTYYSPAAAEAIGGLASASIVVKP